MTLKQKNILVTGATGFVGSHLVERLIELKSNVYATSISSNPHSYYFHQNLHKKSTLLHLDVCDLDRVLDGVSKYSIDYIFHLAAQPLVHVAYLHPRRTLESNIMGTVNILEAARLFDVKGVILASSDKAYGKHGKTKYTEDAPLQGDHPYEVSKSAADLIAHTYSKTYDLPVVTSRFGNIYGPGDLNSSRIVPGIMESIVKNSSLELRSDGKMIRDYLHVKDVVEGYILMAQQMRKVRGEAFNFGSNETLSVIQVIQQVEKALKIKVKYTIKNNQKNEIPYQSLDFSKAKKVLAWEPKLTIKDTAEDILNWYKEVLS